MAQAIDQAIAKLDSILSQLTGPAPSSFATNKAPKPAAAPKQGKSDKGNSANGAAAKPQKSAPTPAASQPTDLFSKANLKVGRLISVEELENSEKLYKTQVDIGNGETKQVLAGLRQYIAKDDLVNRLVIVIVNLKPAKLAGQPSEAMILAADTDVEGKMIVRTLEPPEGAAPGDQVVLQGGSLPESFPKVCKSDDWKKIVPQLKVFGGKATFDGKVLSTSGGAITLPADIVEGSDIH